MGVFGLGFVPPTPQTVCCLLFLSRAFLPAAFISSSGFACFVAVLWLFFCYPWERFFPVLVSHLGEVLVSLTKCHSTPLSNTLALVDCRFSHCLRMSFGWSIVKLFA